MDNYNNTTVKISDPNLSASKKNENDFSHSIVLFSIFILLYFVLTKIIYVYFNAPEGVIALLLIPGGISLAVTILIKFCLKKLNSKFAHIENNIKSKNKVILYTLLWVILTILLLLSMSVFRGNFIEVLKYLFNIPLKILLFLSS